MNSKAIRLIRLACKACAHPRLASRAVSQRGVFTSLQNVWSSLDNSGITKPELHLMSGHPDIVIDKIAKQLMKCPHVSRPLANALVMACLEVGAEERGIEILDDAAARDVTMRWFVMCEIVNARLLLLSRCSGRKHRNRLRNEVALAAQNLSSTEYTTNGQLLSFVETCSRSGVSVPRATLVNIGNKLSYNLVTALSQLPLLRFGEPAQIGNKVNLFVSGCPRSGTTATGQLLRLHEKVAMYTERFNETLGYSPYQFAWPRATGDTGPNHPLHTQWKFTAEKTTTAKYVGDKRPHFLSGWHVSQWNYTPDQIRIVHIIRSPESVAASYVKRSQQASSGDSEGVQGWPRYRNEFGAAFALNTSNRLLEDIMHTEFRNSIYVVRYEQLFTNPECVLSILDWLELSTQGDDIQAMVEFVQKSRERAQCKRLLDPSLLRTFESRFDRELHQRCLSFCSPYEAAMRSEF